MGIEQMLVVVIPFPLCRNDDGSHTICFLVHLAVFHAILFSVVTWSSGSSRATLPFFFIYRVETTAQSRHSSAKFWSGANGGSEDLFPDGGQQSLATTTCKVGAN
jgi:hypothetical protein